MLDLKLSDISKDQQIVLLARDTVIKLLNEDEKLSADKNFPVRERLDEILKAKGDWGRIS